MFGLNQAFLTSEVIFGQIPLILAIPGDSTDFELLIYSNDQIRVDWGDGTVDVYNGHQWPSNNITHTYTSTSTPNRKIKIYANTLSLKNYTPTTNIPDGNILGVLSWGNIVYTAISYFLKSYSIPFQSMFITDHPPKLGYNCDLSGCFNLIDSTVNLTYWDTSSVDNMSSMFANFTGNQLDISDWNTSSVTNMSGMFAGYNGNAVDVSDWNTSSVTDMSGMFAGCQTYPGPIGDWNTSSVTDMSGMFYGSYFAGTLNLNNWDTSSVTNMADMFRNYAQRVYIDQWDTSSVTDMSYMFLNFTGNQLDISDWNTSSVTNMSGMFSAYNGNTLNITDWDVSSVTNMSAMFGNFRPGGYFDQSIVNWDTSSVTDMSNMFYGCNFASGISGTLDFSSVTDMSFMFAEVGHLNGRVPVDIRTATSVTDMSYMFYNAGHRDPNRFGALLFLILNSTSVTDMSYMFSGSHVNLFLHPSFYDNTLSVTNMEGMFKDATRTPSLNSLTTDNVTNMIQMLMNTQMPSFTDLTGWCVTNIPTEPTDFITGTTYIGTSNPIDPDDLPVWGTCP